jgi:hypothetical protein
VAKRLSRCVVVLGLQNRLGQSCKRLSWSTPAQLWIGDGHQNGGIVGFLFVIYQSIVFKGVYIKGCF